MAGPAACGCAAQLGCDRRHLGQRARAEEDERDVQVLGGDDPAAVQLLVLQLLTLPGGDRLDGLAGELQRAEEAHTLIPTHASGRRVTCLSRLGDESPHEVQRRDRGAAADRLAVAGEAETQVALAHRP